MEIISRSSFRNIYPNLGHRLMACSVHILSSNMKHIYKQCKNYPVLLLSGCISSVKIDLKKVLGLVSIIKHYRIISRLSKTYIGNILSFFRRFIESPSQNLGHNGDPNTSKLLWIIILSLKRKLDFQLQLFYSWPESRFGCISNVFYTTLWLEVSEHPKIHVESWNRKVSFRCYIILILEKNCTKKKKKACFWYSFYYSNQLEQFRFIVQNQSLQQRNYQSYAFCSVQCVVHRTVIGQTSLLGFP